MPSTVVTQPPKPRRYLVQIGRMGMIAALLTLPQPAQAKTILSELSPILNGACTYSSQQLITSVVGDVKFLCDLRDMVNSLEPLLSAGSYEKIANTLATRFGANIAQDMGLTAAVSQANAAFAKASKDLQGGVDDFLALGDKLESEAIANHKKGMQFSKAGADMAKVDPEGKAMVEKNAQVIGGLVKSQTVNMARIARSTSASESADTAAQGAVRRSLDTSNPIGGTASKLAGELRAALSTRDAIETVGKIQLEQLKIQAISTATLSQQLAATTQQNAVTNELLIENFNLLMAERIDAITKAEQEYDQYAKSLARMGSDLYSSVNPALATLEQLGLGAAP